MATFIFWPDRGAKIASKCTYTFVESNEVTYAEISKLKKYYLKFDIRSYSISSASPLEKSEYGQDISQSQTADKPTEL